MNAADYLAQQRALLPTGPALPRADDVLAALLAMPAAEFARIEARARDLLAEADPRTTRELLPEWEATYGLPDLCVGAGQSVQERQAALVARVLAVGGQSRAYFIGVAAGLGYAGATITEFRPFTCGAACTAAVTAPAWWSSWRLNLAAAFTIRRYSTRSACADPLRSWGDAALECAIRRLNPAHTHVIFAYPEAV